MDKDEWEQEDYNLVKIGEEVLKTDPNRKFVFYRDSMGRTWYRTFVRTEIGWVTQEQYIFGRSIKRKRRPE